MRTNGKNEAGLGKFISIHELRLSLGVSLKLQIEILLFTNNFTIISDYQHDDIGGATLNIQIQKCSWANFSIFH